MVSSYAIPSPHRFEGSCSIEATNEFLARIPRSSDGKRRGPFELKALIVAETLIEGATVSGMAKRYNLTPIHQRFRLAKYGADGQACFAEP
jgi:transposase-like protein